MKRFIAVFLALVVCFSLVFSFPVSRVSAEPLDELINYEFTTYPLDKILQVDSIIHSSYSQLDDYVLFDIATWTSGSGSRGFYYFPSSSFSNFECFGDKYYLLTKEDNHPYLSKLIGVKTRNPLTPALLETLAIIAYNEPITRIEIDNIRGIASQYIVKKL